MSLCIPEAVDRTLFLEVMAATPVLSQVDTNA
jgi:hypothetical protein